MRRALAAFCVVFLLSGCELLKGLENRRVLAATVVSYPEVAPTHVPGYPDGFPSVPARVVARAFFGEREDGATAGGADAVAPAGVDGALVTVAWRDGDGEEHVVSLRPGAAPGVYEATDGDGLGYVVGARYAFEVVFGTQRFAGEVTAPGPARIEDLPPGGVVAPPSYAGYDAFTMRFDRSGDDLAFYAAYALDAAGPAAALDAPTCANFPLAGGADPAALLGAALDASSWERSSYALPRASCFPAAPDEAPAAYAVALATARRGSFSDELFAGSVVVAAALDAGVVVFTR